jgi:hypothetical protein
MNIGLAGPEQPIPPRALCQPRFAGRVPVAM